MERRPLTATDILQASALWQDAFPNDTPEFLAWFFRSEFHKLRNWSYWEAGQLLAVVYALPYTLQCRGKSFSAPLILGVATHSSARKRGLMRMLMDDVHRDIAEESPACCLYPFRFDFYRNLGYAAVSERLRCRVPASALRDAVANPLDETLGKRLDDTADLARLCAIYQRMSTRFSFFAQRPEPVIGRRLAEMRVDGGRCLSTDDAYAFINPPVPASDSKPVIASEMAYADIPALRRILSAMANEFPNSTLDFSIPVSDAPHDWIADDRGMLSLEPYLMLRALDWPKLLIGMACGAGDVDIVVAFGDACYRIQTRNGSISAVSPSDDAPDVRLTTDQATRWICGRTPAQQLALEGVDGTDLLSFLPAQDGYFFDMY